MNINNFLKELKEYWVQNDIPNISETNARFLRDIIKISKTKNMLEIWTANWYSAINFALELEQNNWKLTTIEFSILSHNQAKDNFIKSWVEKIINPIHWNAIDIIPKLEWNWDFVFIDGMKKRSKDFLDLVYDKVESSWIIIIDDVIKFREKMWDLWWYLEEKQISYNIIPIDIYDWILMIIKK